MYSLPNNVQSIGKVLDNGIKLYLTGLKDVIVLSFIACMLITVPSIMLSNIAEVPTGEDMFLILPVVIICYLIYFVLFLAIIVRLWGVSQSELPGIGESLKHALKCFLPVILSSILYFFAIMLGFLFLIIPGVILSLSLFFYAYFILLEGDGVVQALKHSHKVIWGNWWRTATIITVPLIIMMALYTILFIIVAFTIFQDVDAFMAAGGQSMWMNIGGALINTVIAPLFTSVGLVLFYDLKLRKEGGDLHQRIDSLD